MMRVRITLIDLNGVLVFNGGFAIAAPLEVLVTALKVLLFTHIGIVRTTRYDRQRHEKENCQIPVGMGAGLFVSIAEKSVHIFLCFQTKAAIDSPIDSPNHAKTQLPRQPPIVVSQWHLLVLGAQRAKRRR